MGRLSNRERREADGRRGVSRLLALLALLSIAGCQRPGRPPCYAPHATAAISSAAEVSRLAPLGDLPSRVPAAVLPAPVQLVSVGGADSPPAEPAELPLPEAIRLVDPPALAGPSLRLDEVIRRALLNDPQIAAGLQEITEAQGDWVTAALLPNPELETELSLLPLTRPFTEENPGGPPQLDVWLTYPLDWYLFGKRAAEILATSRGVRAAQEEYADLVRERVLQVAIAYFDLAEAQALLELARQDVQNFEELERITLRSVEAGALPRVELQRVQLDLLASRQEAREMEAAVRIAQAGLLALLGSADFQPDFALGLELSDPLPVRVEAEAAFQRAQELRPDIRALRWRVAQTREETVVEDRNAWPELTAGLGYQRQWQRMIGDRDANGWGAVVSMGLPLFDRNQGGRLQARAALRRTNEELRLALVELRAELEEATQELLAAEQIASSVQAEQLQLAEEVRHAINEAYRIGGRSLLDVLDAQQRFREVYRLYINSRANYWRAFYTFHAAVGQQIVGIEGEE